MRFQHVRSGFRRQRRAAAVDRVTGSPALLVAGDGAYEVFLVDRREYRLPQLEVIERWLEVVETYDALTADRIDGGDGYIRALLQHRDQILRKELPPVGFASD